jgi:hypothetical protein
MNNLFADTSGWAELIDAGLPHHMKCVEIYHQLHREQRKLITSNYVMTELVTLLASPLRFSRRQIITVVQSLKQSPHVEIIHIDKLLDSQSWQLFIQREDKNWSLVDCSSFEIMRQQRLWEALTTDHHFEQAGFTRLLKD